MHSLVGSRTFTLPMHKQHFMFFSAEDVKNGVMDDWIKSVKIKQWQRHDDDNCTVFHFSSALRKSHGIKNLFHDACFSTLIVVTCIGIFARLNEVLYNIGLLNPSNRKSRKVFFSKPKFDCAKKQSIKRIVDMVAQNIGQSKLSSKQIKHEDVDMVAQTIGQSKMSSQRTKHEDTNTLAVTINNASRNKIVAKKSGTKQSPEQVQPVIKENIFIYDIYLHQRLIYFFRLMIDCCTRESNYVPMIYSLMSTSH